MTHTLSSDYLNRIPGAGNTEYLRRMYGIPVNSDVPTPDESRALSEIGRCRRMHTTLVEWRRGLEDAGVFEGDLASIYECASERHREVIHYACETVRRERRLRGA